MTNRTTYPARTAPEDLARAVDEAGGVEAVAERMGVSAEFVRECLVGEREWPEWATFSRGKAAVTRSRRRPNVP